MAVAIRLQMMGKRNRRNFRVVVVDHHQKRDGSVIETVGSVNPLVKPIQVTLDRARIDFWIKNGAQPSDRVKKLLAS